MNLIDREDLLYHLDKNLDWLKNEGWSCKKLWKMVFQTILSAPIETVNEWIPVSEIDPEEELKIGNSKVLVATNYDYYVATFEDGEWISSERMTIERDGEYVIAWKPIEPYTGDKE